jgi:hypothetical protein
MKLRAIAAVFAMALFPVCLRAECIPYTDAPKYVGKITCVRGTVVKVAAGKSGVTYLDYCADYRTCPFVVVIFASDLKQIGDVRQLAGREIEVSGKIKLYNERPEIILRDSGQLAGKARVLPALPKDYDVARRGNFSARSTGSSSKKKKTDQTSSPGGKFTLDPDR